MIACWQQCKESNTAAVREPLQATGKFAPSGDRNDSSNSGALKICR
jgi:hypothetical protein